jgi:prevent-host-death family protein
MAQVPATEFKAKCLEIMDRVAEKRESFTITKRGRPVARLVPVEDATGESLLGSLRGQAWETGDVLKPAVPASTWSVNKPVSRRGRRR